MSVLIKGIEMPTTCVECYMCHYSTCVITESDCNARYSRRNDDCPLIEVPPHGRLGDLDALKEEITSGYRAYLELDGYVGEHEPIGSVDDCIDAIKYAPTIIEAEGSDNG